MKALAGMTALITEMTAVIVVWGCTSTSVARTILPSVDGIARDMDVYGAKDGAGDSTLDGGGVQVLNVPSMEDRGIIEFNLTGAFGTISNAQLVLPVIAANGPFPFEIKAFTYFGDGDLTTSDWAAGSLSMSFAFSGEPTIALDATSVLQDALAQGCPFVGFNLRCAAPSAIVDNGPYVAFGSFDCGPSSSLRVSEVPEPTALAQAMIAVTAALVFLSPRPTKFATWLQSCLQLRRCATPTFHQPCWDLPGDHRNAFVATQPHPFSYQFDRTRSMRDTLWQHLAVTVFATLLSGVPITNGSTAEPVAKIDDLAVLTDELATPVKEDWLVRNVARKAGIYRSGPHEITMTNGLVSRRFRLAPNAATVGFDNLMTGVAIIRGVKPEAVLEFDGEKYAVGGLVGQPEYAYLRPEWIDAMKADPAAFQLTGFAVGSTAERFAWKRKPYSSNLPWPPPGASLTLTFRPPPKKLPGVSVSVHYELYDGIPLVGKWLTIRNDAHKPVRLNTFVNEVLAAVPYETTGPVKPGWEYPNIHVESDYAMNGVTPLEANLTTQWMIDPQYTTQRWQTPTLMESRPPLGPDAVIPVGGTFETFRTFELIYDSTDRERKGLALRRMYRTIAPWSAENPIYMHVLPADPHTVRQAIDQCAAVGFEMVVLSFESGFDIENEDPAYVAQVKALADYAHSKGIALGGYSLLASRSVGTEHDVIDPKTGKPGGAVYDNMPCLGGKWGVEYVRKVRTFLEQTGMDLFEHDGSYPGDLCASTSHAGHRGLADSQWTQWKTITELYRWCRGQGIYLNVPDWYFLNGSNKVFLGYCEENWKLPRAGQVILSRQNIFDGTWQKTPSMGWSFLPLVSYKHGGPAATIEPLSSHLNAYGAHLAQNFGCGIQCCYRGSRLYDTDATKTVVKQWVDFYKKYRPILDSDIIHVRRPDARDIDCMMHVNPQLQQKGFAVVFNPLDHPVKKMLSLPLYYTGLTDVAMIRREEGQPLSYKLDRQYNVELPIEMAPQSVTWFVIE